ncbi:MAG: hypothetical protein RL213_2318 [Bacteroidota bacterium]|jgi:RND family efflux transporter MFP subunit
MRSKLPFFALAALLSACGGNGNDNVERLNELKKQQSALREEIARLEAEIASADTTAGDGKSKLIATTIMRPSAFTHYVEVQGRVEGDQDVTIGAEMPGTVTKVLVNAGDAVLKGQLLATLDDRVIRQGLQEVETQFELANQVYERQKNLWQQKIGSEIQFLQAKTAKDALEKRLATTREQLEMTRIKSPISGTVDQVMTKTGQAAAPGVPAFRIVNLQDLKVVGEVAESYISGIKTGNETVIVFPDLDKSVVSRLDHAGKAINRLNRTFNVEVHLKDENGTFRPNMVAVLKIADYSNPKSFTLPVGAIQRSGEGSFVYVTETSGKSIVAKRRNVKTGMTYNGITQILEGITEGDEVITTGYQGVIEGDAVSR